MSMRSSVALVVPVGVSSWSFQVGFRLFARGGRGGREFGVGLESAAGDRDRERGGHHELDHLLHESLRALELQLRSVFGARAARLERRL
jgi:hypothetical protein